jgi:Amt family ammonium transporter
VSYVVFSLIDNLVGGIRLNGEKEALGLDRLEHDVEAYPEFGMGENGSSEAPVDAEAEAESVA